MILSHTQQKNIKNTITETIDLLENRFDDNLSKTKKHFINKITNQYNSKSYRQLTYFLRNISNGYNKRTGELINGLYDNYNNYKYKPNLYLNDNNKLKMQEVEKGKYLDKKQFQYAHKKVAKSLYLEYHNKNKNRVFITFTLPSKWHYYKRKGKIKNKDCMFDNYEISVKESLKQLNKINRYLNQLLVTTLKRYYKKQNKEYESYQFIKVLEYHFSLTGHSHHILYCNNEQLPMVEKVYNIVKKKFNLKKTTCEVITNKKASSYVYKYLLKNMKDEKKDKGAKKDSVFNRYKSYFNNIRIFSSSNFKYTNQAQIDKVYKYISSYRPKLMKYLKSLDIPLYVSLENLILKGYFKFEYEIKEQTIIDKKQLQKYIKQEYQKSNISAKNKLFSKFMKQKDLFVKTNKIKRLTKVFAINKTTKLEKLAYHCKDFKAKKKDDFIDELLGTYVDDMEDSS